MLNGQAIQVFGANGFISPEDTNGRILVLIQLDGGNDGLNTLIPLDMYDNLAKVRPQIILPENKILHLTELNGIHPSMDKIKNLFEEESVMFLQNVGYPQPNLSHFRSKEIILSASDSQTNVSSGWFGRYLEELHPTYPENYPNESYPHPLAVTIGSSSSPTCQGDINNLGVVLTNLTTSYSSQSGVVDFPNTPYGYELHYITQIMQSTEKYLAAISETADMSETISENWPDSNSLADKLKIVARLITGGLATPIYVVNLGGFDTHANQVVQGNMELGKHADLLKYVSDAIYAFQDELAKHNKQDDVIGLVYSEFGRRIASNNSSGTDHGEAFPMMLFGNQVNPVIYGSNPEIPEAVETKTNVPMEIDFRSVYASILHHWFQVETTDIQNILFDEFTILPILKSNSDIIDVKNQGDLKISNIFPNPVLTDCRINFKTSGGPVTLKLYNYSGQEIRVLLNAKLPGGNQSIHFSRIGLSNGQYYLVLQNKFERITQAFSIQ